MPLRPDDEAIEVGARGVSARDFAGHVAIPFTQLAL